MEVDDAAALTFLLRELAQLALEIPNYLLANLFFRFAQEGARHDQILLEAILAGLQRAAGDDTLTVNVFTDLPFFGASERDSLDLILKASLVFFGLQVGLIATSP